MAQESRKWSSLNFPSVSMNLKVEIIEEVKSGIDKNELKKHLIGAFLDFARNLNKASLEIIFVQAEKIQELNRTYRNKDKPTDVLSFPAYINEVGGKVIIINTVPNLGTIFICPDVARDQIGKFGETYEEEIFELAIHGLRHLLGHDHDSEGNWIESKI